MRDSGEEHHALSPQHSAGMDGAQRGKTLNNGLIQNTDEVANQVTGLGSRRCDCAIGQELKFAGSLINLNIEIGLDGAWGPARQRWEDEPVQDRVRFSASRRYAKV
jgi:hypothetical protein